MKNIIGEAGMTTREEIGWEYKVLKHLVELGCPESKIEREISEHPVYIRQLREEVNYDLNRYDKVQQSTSRYDKYT